MIYYKAGATVYNLSFIQWIQRIGPNNYTLQFIGFQVPNVTQVAIDEIKILLNIDI
jgi:hypothetical protein